MSTTLEQRIVENQLELASSPEGIYTLPCGHLDDEGVLHTEVLLRELTGVEEDILASKRIPSHQKMNKFLANCTQRIGSIVDPREIASIVPKLLLGDRTFLFFALRRLSVGDIFPFREKCPECREMAVYSYDLGDLKVTVMPDPKKRIYEVTLPRSGKSVTFRCLAGQDEQEADRLKKRKMPPLTAQIYLRVVDIDGKPRTQQDIQKLPTRDRDFLRAQFATVDGGVETTLELDCGACGAEFEEEISPGQQSFFFPSEAQEIWKRRSSS